MKIDLDNVEYITETSLTIRGSRRRTTVPKEIVERLDLRDGDRLRWIMLRDGRVLLLKPHPAESHAPPSVDTEL